ncbi:hypothetical protein MCOR02_002674 [Pyricularia oryzae]|nr:hypothetical protein MCOR02_002674 [Pyricularia oryzae]KAI6467365.1 hypothetical protein MCOR17_004485 [Pyricularia oryzae]KAI6500621.1 hypothetical protein MCOR13_005911 [Pyricularia oryzae]KAI6632655.1 hypothetical protein MCOR14_007111 [Pyricularia oryzae]
MGSIAQQYPATLLSVAAKITEYATQLAKELEAGNVPPIKLEADSPTKTLIKQHAMLDIATPNVLNQFDFRSAVPVDGTATHKQIAETTEIPAEVV